MLPIRIGPYRAEAHETENARYGSPLFFVHGLWTGAWIWQPIAGYLAHRGWEAIALDLRGRPQSRSAALKSVGLADYVEDLVAMVHERGGAAPILVGHGVGGLVALLAAARVDCRALIALAPPLRGAVRPELAEALRRRIGWFDRRLPPPEIGADEGIDPERLIADSPRVAKAVLEGVSIQRCGGSRVLLVGGERDRLVDSDALASEASRQGWGFARRPAPHWGLAGRGYERQADIIHRWLVRELGDGLLRLTGFEDLDEDEDEEIPG